MTPWTVEDAAVQLDALLAGRRAGLGPTVLRLAADGADGRPVVEVLGPECDERTLLTGAALALGWRMHGSGYGDGSGYGYGSGSGSGSGDGSGYGDGYGSGYGSGSGYGYGSGSGSGSGDGYGDGDGVADGVADGDGDGYGYGEYAPYAPLYIVSESMTNIDKTKPVLIRHHLAGVYLGYYQGPGIIPGTHRVWCRHIWRWAGRLGVTPIATHGPGDGSSVGPWVSVHLPQEQLVEIVDATPEAMEVLDKTPVSIAVSIERMADA